MLELAKKMRIISKYVVSVILSSLSSNAHFIIYIHDDSDRKRDRLKETNKALEDELAQVEADIRAAAALKVTEKVLRTELGSAERLTVDAQGAAEGLAETFLKKCLRRANATDSSGSAFTETVPTPSHDTDQSAAVDWDTLDPELVWRVP